MFNEPKVDSGPISAGLNKEKDPNFADVSQKLIDLSQASETPTELSDKKAQFEAIYKELPEIATELTAFYRKLLSAFNLNPGEIKLFMVGGRVRGQPLKADSDLDLIFVVERPLQAAESANEINGQDIMESMETKSYLKRAVKEGLKKLCESKGISNQFHIINYGSSSQEPNPENSLRIA